MRIFYVLLFCFVALSAKTEVLSQAVEIIQPLDNSRYIGENSTFVIKTSLEKVDKIVITQENNTSVTVDIKASKNTYCKTIKLHAGENSVIVESFKDSKLVATDKRKFYFLSELFEGVDEDEAEEFTLRYFHTDKQEAECKACHTMSSNIPRNGEAFEDVSKTTCYECHKGMINSKNTHAPVVNWLCVDCHNGKFGEYNMDSEGASKYLAPDPIAKTCASCHEDVSAWKNSKYGHGPVNDGRCERCHNPHGSDNEFFLRKPIWELCTTCHLEKADGKHVVSSYVFSRNSGGHPTKGFKDPARPSREFTCSSCHNPHGSNGTMLLRMNGSMAFGVCNRCHKK